MTFLSGRTLNLVGDCFLVRCCTHILNLIVQYGLNEIVKFIGKVRKRVKFVKGSTLRNDSFYKYVCKLNAPKHYLVFDVKAYWISTYKMISVALEFKDVFDRYSCFDMNGICPFLG